MNCFSAYSAGQYPFKEGDVVAFIGGGDVAAAQHTGHLESLLTAEFPGVRFRNFGWEGDTVFAQPRDFNFPPLVEHLRKAQVTTVIVQFGRTEALSDRTTHGFADAYRKLISEILQVTPKPVPGEAPRLMLVTPVPFEKSDAPLPDLTLRNTALETIAKHIRKVGREQSFPVIDLYAGFPKRAGSMDEDGLQMSSIGHAVVAQVFAATLGLGGAVQSAGEVEANGAWANPRYETLRQAIIVKNRLWFNYWRPQNWAFLGGDRIEQPSSRDHRDPKVRWFPAEMEKFRGLIDEKEAEVAMLARKLNEK